MNDARTLAVARRRRRAARRDVFVMTACRSAHRAADAYAALGEVAAEAAEHASDAAIAFEVHRMWEQACAAVDE